MDMSNMRPMSFKDLRAPFEKSLYRSICVPSTVQSYSLCIEYMKNWFLSKFDKDTFKSIYVDGKNIYDDFRSLSKLELIKRQKPSLAIIPSITWDFNNDNVDSYPYGLELYAQMGKFRESFFRSYENNSFLGIGMRTLFMPFTFKVRVETRAQQLDLYEYIKMACRVGFTNGENVDLDFHIPYPLMIQLARDNGFEVEQVKEKNREVIKDIPKFLRWLNMHSALPFLYKFRTLNGNNEFFLRLRKMYVHIRPTDLSADDGEREGQMTNNFSIELNAECRFPAPKMYAYYSNGEHRLKEIYSAWYQPHGPISTCYTFKATPIPEENEYGWPLFMSTTYEDEAENIGKPFNIELRELLEGDIGECIVDCLQKAISPGIFLDLKFYNRGEYIHGHMDWESLTFKSDTLEMSRGTFIGVYVDNDFVSDFILKKSGYNNRIQKSEKQI